LSEIRANTISDAAGTGPVDLHKQSAAKAWVNFNGQGTVAIRDSVNVSSLTDNAAGDYGVSYSNSFSDANYGYVTTTSNVASLRASTLSVVSVSSATYRASTALSGYVAATTYTDNPQNNCVIHGDLA
jgi:hypothetical protein